MSKSNQTKNVNNNNNNKNFNLNVTIIDNYNFISCFFSWTCNNKKKCLTHTKIFFSLLFFYNNNPIWITVHFVWWTVNDVVERLLLWWWWWCLQIDVQNQIKHRKKTIEMTHTKKKFICDIQRKKNIMTFFLMTIIFFCR